MPLGAEVLDLVSDILDGGSDRLCGGLGWLLSLLGLLRGRVLWQLLGEWYEVRGAWKILAERLWNLETL